MAWREVRRPGGRSSLSCRRAIGTRNRAGAAGGRAAAGFERREKAGVVAHVGRDPVAARGRDVDSLFLVVGSGDTPGVPAYVALGGRLPRPGGQCAQQDASKLWITHVANLG